MLIIEPSNELALFSLLSKAHSPFQITSMTGLNL